MRNIFAPLALAALFLLAACDTFDAQRSLDYDHDAAPSPTGSEASLSPFNWSPQQYAGLTAGRIIYPGENGAIVVEFLSGKEAENADVAFTTPDGNLVTYSTQGLRAFEGQLARADVEKAMAAALSDLWQNVTPEIKSGIVDAVCLYVTKAPCN